MRLTVSQDSKVKLIVEWFIESCGALSTKYGQGSPRIVKDPTSPIGWLHPASFVSNHDSDVTALLMQAYMHM